MYNNGIVQAASSRLALALRWHRDDPKKVAAARDALLSARLERAIHEALQPHEPGFKKLSKAERERLAKVLLHG